MSQDNTKTDERTWQESGHASLCLLGSFLRSSGFFQPWEARLRLQQKALKYTPVQKLAMLFIALLAGAKAVSHTNFTLRPDPALPRAFGLPGCAEQSVLADTLDTMTEADLDALREVLADLFERYSQARRHNFGPELLVLDVDLSPLPASRYAQRVGARLHGALPLEDGPQAGARTRRSVSGDRLGGSPAWTHGGEPGCAASRPRARRTAAWVGGGQR